MNLGNKILKIRKDNKMSQEAFAEILNVTRQTVSNWENSKNYPDIETLILISDKFNISLDILLKGDLAMIKDFDKKIKNNQKFKIIIIILILAIILTYTGKYVYWKVRYYMNINQDYGSSITNKCNLNGERLKVMAIYKAYNQDKKWYETFSYDASITKPDSFKIVTNDTKEEKTELEEQMNINLNDYATAVDLLHYMEDYIISIGGTCDNHY